MFKRMSALWAELSEQMRAFEMWQEMLRALHAVPRGVRVQMRALRMHEEVRWRMRPTAMRSAMSIASKKMQSSMHWILWRALSTLVSNMPPRRSMRDIFRWWRRAWRSLRLAWGLQACARVERNGQMDAGTIWTQCRVEQQRAEQFHTVARMSQV